MSPGSSLEMGLAGPTPRPPNHKLFFESPETLMPPHLENLGTDHLTAAREGLLKEQGRGPPPFAGHLGH